jgi:MFS family permease
MSALKKNASPGSIFLGLSSFQALAMFRRGVFYTFLGVYLRSYLGLSVTETTLFETIPMLLNVAFQALVWGRLTDKLQLRRSLIIAGEVMASAGHLLMWYFHSIAPDPRAAGYVVIWGLSIIEIFWSMSNVGWSAFISDVYSVERRNAVQGKLASIGGIGRIAGALLGGLLYDGLGKAYPGWGFKEGGIFFAAALAMLVSVIPLLFIPEGGIGYRMAAIGDGSGAAGGKAEGGDLLVFVIFVLAMLLVNSGANSLASIKGQYLDLDEGFAASPGAISLVMNVESGSLIVAGLFMGFLGRKMGIPGLLVMGTSFGIVSLSLYAAAPGIGLVYLASVFKGASEGCIASSSYAFASTLMPPEKRGRYFAVFNAAFFLSWGLSATLLTGPLIDSLLRAGRNPVFAYRMGVASALALMLIGLCLLSALLAFLRPRRPRGPALKPGSSSAP